MSLPGEPPSRVGLLISDADGRVLFMSQPLAERFGWTPSPADACTIDRVVPQYWASIAGVVSTEPLRVSTVPLNDREVVDVCILAGENIGAPLAPSHAQQVAKLTHDLNNVFTVIYAGVAMVLAHEMSEEERKECLVQTQVAARNGSKMVTEIRQIIGREHRGDSAAPNVAVEAAFSPCDGNEKVLLASAHTGLRLRLRAVLAYRGYEIVESARPAEALAGHDARIVITDDEAVADAWTGSEGRAPLLVIAERSPARPEHDVHWLSATFENTMLLSKVRAVLDEIARPNPT